jgi:hypothetical protein
VKGIEPGHLAALTEADRDTIMPYIVARFYGWSWRDVQELSEPEYAAALAVMSGINAAQNEA